MNVIAIRTLVFAIQINAECNKAMCCAVGFVDASVVTLKRAVLAFTIEVALKRAVVSFTIAQGCGAALR